MCFLEDSLYCLEKDDVRFQAMCCHYLSDSACQDVLLGAEECQSPFGSYELTIPVDEDVDCRPDSSQLTNKNCKDFDVSLFIIDIVLGGYLTNISVLILCLPSIAKSTEQFLKKLRTFIYDLSFIDKPLKQKS